MSGHIPLSAFVPQKNVVSDIRKVYQSLTGEECMMFAQGGARFCCSPPCDILAVQTYSAVIPATFFPACSYSLARKRMITQEIFGCDLFEKCYMSDRQAVKALRQFAVRQRT